MHLRLMGCLPLLIVSACRSQETREIPLLLSEYSAFKDVSDAPPTLRESANAVVKVAHLESSGTGFFARLNGQVLFVTNNHVVGDENCPSGGCNVWADLQFQKGSKSEHIQLHLELVARDPDVDVAFFRFERLDDGAPVTGWAPPGVLNVVERKASDLVGKPIYVVGHPVGGLKKWSEGKVVRTDNGYAVHNALSTHGNSGSPILSADGAVIGILHSGRDDFMAMTARGRNAEGMQSPSALLLQVLTEKRGLDLVDAKAPLESLDAFVEKAPIFAVGNVAPTFANEDFDWRTAILEACEAGVAKPAFNADRFEANIRACRAAASFLISCNSNSNVRYCPEPGHAERWDAAFLTIAKKMDSFSGRTGLFWLTNARTRLWVMDEALALRMREDLITSIERRGGNLSFLDATHLIWFDPSNARFHDLDLYDFLRNYAKQPGYWLEMDSLVAAIETAIEVEGFSSEEEGIALLHGLFNDPLLSLKDRLCLEETLYRQGAL